MPTLKTITLGCKVNQYETQYLRRGLARLGYRDAKRDENVDLCIVNTCTVTAESDMKSRKAIRRLARMHPEAEIIVMGCYAVRDPETLASLPGVRRVLLDKSELPLFLRERGLTVPPTGIDRSAERARAFIKVQDGCRQHCAYCIIPHVRPKLRSRPAADVVAEIQSLLDAGTREFVLTGIHLGHYGRDDALDRGKTNLAQLVQDVLTAAASPSDDPFRLRLSSMEATEVTTDLLELMASQPERICPHLHVSMQSGSDTVLRRMRRRQTADEFLARCETIRQCLEHPALTTDVIVGFPGETEAEFLATCDLVEQIGFSKVHIFRFSPRRGTPAATMDGQIREDEKRARAEHLAQLESRLRAAYFASLQGRSAHVLVETVTEDGAGRGTSERYATVRFEADPSAVGNILPVRITGADCDGLIGEKIESCSCRENR